MTAKLNSANISYLYIYVCQSLIRPPNLNPPIFLQWRFRAQLPNLIPANISSYMIYPQVCLQGCMQAFMITLTDKDKQLMVSLEYSSILCAKVIKKQQTAAPEHKEGRSSFHSCSFISDMDFLVIYMKAKGFQATKKQPKYVLFSYHLQCLN